MNSLRPTLEIVSAERDGKLVLKCSQVMTDRLPSLAFEIEVVKRGFSRINPEIWVDASTLAGFIRRLEQIDRVRSGEATLSAMSPGEFELVIKGIDHVGHLLVTASVARTQYVGAAPVLVTDSVVVSFELDPSLLGNTLETFRQIYRQIA